jgi:hypothetical protein
MKRPPLLILLFLLSLHCPLSAKTELHLSEKEASEVGHKVWKNECSGRIEGLTSWNSGEEFPSLGIGHFIWYPEGTKGPFDESFPKVLSFLQEHKVKLPEWLKPDMQCPWKSRKEFLEEQNSKRMLELRNMLSSTVGLQTDYLVQRLENALPKMLDKAPEADKAKVKRNFERMLASGSAGAFALIDYVNFKGEGVVDTERYKGEGWGMLQVLQNMSESKPAVEAFSESAKELLARRVRNSPPERHEEKWLPGWTRRVSDYAK